ncbi:RimK family alpha-L-glutamate ligase [Pseudoalteromonas sp. P1-9]|uniref:ATP-grasp domain-containing protein n=1 Tax=Pseudoalteromonas sp. P1-9 TaxID=1710354 RepID=UPI0006D63739|nr:hypothetical protein [Pseudoalteromonas sp. P1-9]
MKKCAFLSMDCLDEFEVYDELVEPYLNELGFSVDTVSWRNTGVDWEQYEMVVIRTPWDYQDAPEAFLSVLEQIENSQAELQNTLDIVRWNIDKIYLQELGELGVRLIPTKWQNRLDDTQITKAQIESFFSEFDTQEIIIKPRISANADNTFWLKVNQHVELADLNNTFKERDFMVQPFVPEVVKNGEYSLFYFNGEYSHAILKTPKQNDFRVQEEHGGSLTSITPDASLLEAAKKCMIAIQRVHTMPLYARLDLVKFDGEFCLMEAELIEPSLYFNMDEQSPKRFANAIKARLT